MLRLGECHGELAWGVAQTQSGKEALATSQIVAAGLSCFWPRYEKTEVIRGRVQKRTISLFPGYVFFGFAPESWLWRVVRHQPGVAWVIQASPECPSLVSGAFLRELVGHEAELAHNLTAARRAFDLRPGATVRIRDERSAFYGLWVKLIKLDVGGRITLLLDILGGPTPVGGFIADQVEAV